jgi:hypothetical protein
MLRSGCATYGGDATEASPAWKGRPFARAAQGDIAKFQSSWQLFIVSWLLIAAEAGC